MERAVTERYGCRCTHVGSYFTERGCDCGSGLPRTVELFHIESHPEAEQAFAWSWTEKGEIRYTVLPRIPPIDSVTDALKVAIENERQR